MNEKRVLLKVIVGSQAHGLATPESDFDYRGVFLVPTSEILALGNTKIQQTNWIEGKEDDTSWELGHFLNMATHCNPTVLETFLAPLDPKWELEASPKDLWYAGEIRSLFPYLWNSNDVKNAFIGYGFNQRKKMLEEKDKRPHKYAAAYLRVLYNCYQLLSEGTFSVDLRGTPVYETVKKFKMQEFTMGEVIDACYTWQTRIEDVFRKMTPKEADLKPVNDFLLQVRKENW
jgi:predicted nucleotidyltransferase